MGSVDLTILRLAAWEILFAEGWDVPGSVAISEAVHLAKQYADEDSTVTVELVKKGLRVINSFGGTTSTDASMDAKKLSDPFYKSDKSRSGRKGSGIGLSIVKNIIEMHGWRFKTKVKDGVFVAEIQM